MKVVPLSVLAGVVVLGALAACASEHSYEEEARKPYRRRFAGPEALSAKDPPTDPREAGPVPIPCDGGGPIDADRCGVSFRGAVMPLLVGACGSATCHGAASGALPEIDRTSATITYANLVSQRAIDTKPYVDVCSTDPARSGIACNLAVVPCGIGMPHGAPGSLASSALAAALDGWLACGAPNN